MCDDFKVFNFFLLESFTLVLTFKKKFLKLINKELKGKLRPHLYLS